MLKLYPLGLPFSRVKLAFRSEYVAELIQNTWTKKTLADQLNFYKMARQSPAAGSLAGNIFEFIAHEQLSKPEGRTYKYRQLDQKKQFVSIYFSSISHKIICSRREV